MIQDTRLGNRWVLPCPPSRESVKVPARGTRRENVGNVLQLRGLGVTQRDSTSAAWHRVDSHSFVAKCMNSQEALILVRDGGTTGGGLPTPKHVEN